MASITIRNLDDPIKKRLRIRAAHHGRSMEEEARSILRAALVDGARKASRWSSGRSTPPSGANRLRTASTM